MQHQPVLVGARQKFDVTNWLYKVLMLPTVSHGQGKTEVRCYQLTVQMLMWQFDCTGSASHGQGEAEVWRGGQDVHWGRWSHRHYWRKVSLLAFFIRHMHSLGGCILILDIHFTWDKFISRQSMLQTYIGFFYFFIPVKMHFHCRRSNFDGPSCSVLKGSLLSALKKKKY